MKERDHFGDLRVEGRTIFRWIFWKWDQEVGTRSSWFKIGTAGGNL